METSYETETKNKAASTWAGFWFMVFVTSLIVASWGRARPNRRADIPPLRWVLQMKKRTTDEHNHLAALGYRKADKGTNRRKK